jgi:penicillin-binding protein 2
MPIMSESLNPIQLARFEEQSAAEQGMDLEVQSMRYYPNGPIAAHLLGYLQRNNESSEGERTNYNYRLPDYVGVTGMEGLFDDDLRGSAGEKSVLVNYLGYRQSEKIWTPAEPGRNVVLTIDLDIQKAADEALKEAQANVRGAVIVMDAQNGDVLAMASAPTYDPNYRIRPDPNVAEREKENERWDDPVVGLQRNRAIYENYHPGSIFKIIVGMAALELGVLDPNAIFHSDGYYLVGRSSRHYGDTAGAGEFDFNRAMAKSSNPYFVHYGTNAGVLQKVIALGQRLHLGERTGIVPHQEASGNLPTLERISSDWHLGDTANMSIGQGEVDVTPIQMAVMTAAVGNGGTVFWPRVVMRTENQDGSDPVEAYPQGRVRDHLGVSQHTLDVIRAGMLADVDSAEGSGRRLGVTGWTIAGKTGTAEVERGGEKIRSAKNTWFVSYSSGVDGKAHYVVVATVEGGASGGLTCVPIAGKVYKALQLREQQPPKKKASTRGTLAAAQ